VTQTRWVHAAALLKSFPRGSRDNRKTTQVSGNPDVTSQLTPARRTERRRGERRQEIWRSLLRGSLTPRRRVPRREDERGVTAVDWHHPQWLATGLLIVSLSCADALLTLVLMHHGAYEANPLMAPLVAGSALRFALVKIVLTTFGVLVLAQLSRLRAFGRLPVGTLLYTVLAVYAALVVYEFRLLNAYS
jgi:hypothetical protein